MMFWIPISLLVLSASWNLLSESTGSIPWGKTVWSSSALIPVEDRNFIVSQIYCCPQTKFAKVMFLQASVCPRGGSWGVRLGEGLGPLPGEKLRGLAGGMSRTTSRGRLRDLSWGCPGTHLGDIPACTETYPPFPAYGYCCGRYTSYWKAFLSIDHFQGEYLKVLILFVRSYSYFDIILVKHI